MKSPISHILITLGGALIVVGLLWPLLQKAGLGRLPGDIVGYKVHLSFYFPLSTSIIVSRVLTLLFWFFRRYSHTRRRRSRRSSRQTREQSRAYLSQERRPPFRGRHRLPRRADGAADHGAGRRPRSQTIEYLTRRADAERVTRERAVRTCERRAVDAAQPALTGRLSQRIDHEDLVSVAHPVRPFEERLTRRSQRQSAARDIRREFCFIAQAVDHSQAHLVALLFGTHAPHHHAPRRSFGVWHRMRRVVMDRKPQEMRGAGDTRVVFAEHHLGTQAHRLFRPVPAELRQTLAQIRLDARLILARGRHDARRGDLAALVH